METQLLAEISSELTIIKWALIIDSVLVALTVIGLFLMYRGMRHAEKMSEGMLDSRLFRSEAEDLNDRSRYPELRDLAERRLKTHTDDKWALYYLGISSMRLADYPAAKAHFTRIRDLDPMWEDSVAVYLDEIDDILRRNKPRSV